MDPPSSGGESDFEEIKEPNPSINDVANKLRDLKTIMIIKNNTYFPKEAKPCILIIGLEDWVDETYIKMFLDKTPILSNLESKLYYKQIYFFNYSYGNNNTNCVWIKFDNDLSTITRITDFFCHPIRSICPTLNSKGEKMLIYLSFDLLDITLSKWYAVVLRNLPKNVDKKEIKEFVINNNFNPKYCVEPMLIKSKVCTIVVMNELEEAENFCMKMNKYCLNNNSKFVLKVHLHPQTCKIRFQYSVSSPFYKMFNKNGYNFSEDILSGQEALKNSTNFEEIYISEYIGNKNFEFFKKEEGEIKDEDSPDNLDTQYSNKVNNINQNLIKAENSTNLTNNCIMDAKKNNKGLNQLDLIAGALMKLKGNNEQKKEKIKIEFSSSDKIFYSYNMKERSFYDDIILSSKQKKIQENTNSFFEKLMRKQNEIDEKNKNTNKHDIYHNDSYSRKYPKDYNRNSKKYKEYSHSYYNASYSYSHKKRYSRSRSRSNSYSSSKYSRHYYDKHKSNKSYHDKHH